VRAGRFANAATEVVVEPEPEKQKVGIGTVLAGRPLWFSVVGFALAVGFVFVPPAAAILLAVLVLVVGEAGYLISKRDAAAGRPSWFGIIERRPLAFTVLVIIAILVGGVAELVTTILIEQAVPRTGAAEKPYTPLELQGRDIYVREGCYVCHSQMVRPMLAEYARYGEAGRAEEFIYDHPFQWGSKRTGPDLERVGGKYPNLWHYSHLLDPRAVTPGSNMPSYPWLVTHRIDVPLARQKLLLMQKLGVPYTNAQIDSAADDERAQGEAITTDLAAAGIQVEPDREIVALISYLQRLGRDRGVAPLTAAAPTPAAAVPAAPAESAEPSTEGTTGGAGGGR